MLDRAAEKCGMLIAERINEHECTAADRAAMSSKTLTVLEDNDFTRNTLDKLVKLPMSYLCRVESFCQLDNHLIAVSSDAGKRQDIFSYYDAYAACCAAIVLKECGAVHTSLCQSVRHDGERIRVFGLEMLEPYSEAGEKNEVDTIGQACGINAGSLESLREKLAIHIERRKIMHRKASEGERIKGILLAQSSFTSEWKHLEYINAGAYGYIYRALSAIDGKEYALKVMCVGNDMEMLWKAKRESSNASQFHASKYIVKSFDDGKVTAEGEKYIWISMELLDPVPCEISDEKTVAMIARDVCCALEEMHKNGGIAHRDVKPANILRGTDCWKLCDFGITKEVQGREMSTVIGTSEFMAPELLRAAATNSSKTNYDNTVDIYALGITMYILLNRGAAPFIPMPPYIPGAADQKNASIRRIQGEPLTKPINCSERLMKIIQKACSPNPKNRYSSAGCMLDALEDFLEG